MDTHTLPANDLTELLAAVSAASCLDQISTLMLRVRAWLADHPDDAQMQGVLQDLMRMEHAYFD
ncbi:MAG: hypothetical protein ABI828_03085 [Actinomycetota bacterium]